MSKALEARMDALEKRQSKVEQLVRTWNKKLVAIKHNMKHYLAHRMPLRQQYAEKMRGAVESYERFLNMVEKTKVTWTRKAEKGPDHVLLMVNTNQAEKLRRLADGDMRKFNGG